MRGRRQPFRSRSWREWRSRPTPAEVCTRNGRWRPNFRYYSPIFRSGKATALRYRSEGSNEGWPTCRSRPCTAYLKYSKHIHMISCRFRHSSPKGCPLSGLHVDIHALPPNHRRQLGEADHPNSQQGTKSSATGEPASHLRPLARSGRAVIPTNLLIRGIAGIGTHDRIPRNQCGRILCCLRVGLQPVFKYEPRFRGRDRRIAWKTGGKMLFRKHLHHE